MGMLEGKVVAITGAGRGVGREIALLCAKHGAAVVVNDPGVGGGGEGGDAGPAQDVVNEILAMGGKAHANLASVADPVGAASIIEDAVQRFGRIDAVVNNASTFEHDEVDSFSYARLEQMMRANCAPAVVLGQALHAHLAVRPGSGCVVNVLDQKLWNPNPDHFSYTLSKAALESATTLMALALAPAVRVCGVAPGLTLESGPMGSDEFQRAFRMTPLQRASTPQDIARSVRFLLESPAITGTAA